MYPQWAAVLGHAEAQYGLVGRDEMRVFHVTDRMIASALDDGLLSRVAPELFRVRGVPQTERMAIAAAALAVDGAVSFGAAASLLRLDARTELVPIDVTVDASVQHPRLKRVEVATVERSLHPIRLHRFASYGEPLVVVDGIRCADAARVLVDLAGRLRPGEFEDVFERARRLGLVTPEALARRFEVIGGRGRKGAAKVRELLATTRPGPLDSKLEGRTWRMIRASRLEEPVRQLPVDISARRRYRIDFAWPGLLVAVEAEGFEWHGSRARWKADKIRTAALERLGWRVLVVTWDDVTHRPEETLDRIAMALAERARLVAAL